MTHLGERVSKNGGKKKSKQVILEEVLFSRLFSLPFLVIGFYFLIHAVCTREYCDQGKTDYGILTDLHVQGSGRGLILDTLMASVWNDQ